MNAVTETVVVGDLPSIESLLSSRLSRLLMKILLVAAKSETKRGGSVSELRTSEPGFSTCCAGARRAGTAVRPRDLDQAGPPPEPAETGPLAEDVRPIRWASERTCGLETRTGTFPAWCCSQLLPQESAE